MFNTTVFWLHHKGQGSYEAGVEEEWHLELRARFVFQYIKYLQTIGFQYVQMDRTLDKGKPIKGYAVVGWIIKGKLLVSKSVY